MNVACHRDDVCSHPSDEEWSPWCSRTCYLIATRIEELPLSSSGAPKVGPAAVRFAFSWLDSRHPDARPVDRRTPQCSS